MGTAGHIDHGKTSLVRALTGVDCDRLSEEKERGITIELGFAFLDFADGSRLSIVDVPGHEKFVKNMVAGAAGIDFVVLVIAADEGIMPQTREHLEICTLLGVKKGIIALTKMDMVDAEWAEMVQEEVGQYFSGTFLEEAPVIPVSSRTGAGMDELKAALGELKDSFGPKKRTDLARLPVDRVFTIKGHGTVVTGTLVSGFFKLGEEVRLYPSAVAAKIRGLQSHSESVEDAPAGRRTAVNLQGVEVREVSKGNILARPDTLFPETVWEIELTLLQSSPIALKHRREVHFHHGSNEVMARIYLLDRDELAPGETAICQVRFTSPLAAVYGDRFVIRSFSPLRTIGGGSVVSPLGHNIKRHSDAVDEVKGLADSDPSALAVRQLELAGVSGLNFAELMVVTNADTKSLDKVMNDLSGRQQAVLFDKDERRYASGTMVAELCDDLLQWLSEFHAENSMKPGVGRGELASLWGRNFPAKLFHMVLERSLKSGKVVSELDVLRLDKHKVSLASDTALVRENVLDAYEKGGIRPPNVKDVLEPMGVDFKQAAPVFRMLVEERLLTKINENIYYHTPAIDGIRDGIIRYFDDHEEMTPQDFKAVADLSRKYSIPVLEYFDKQKLTVRVGDARRLRKSGVKG